MKSLKAFLIDLANNELKGNLLSWIIANYFDKISRSNKESLYESVSVYYSSHKDEEELPTLASVEDIIDTIEGLQDLRINAVTLSNVRGVPEKFEGFPFGIDFTENNEIKSAVILGPNGTGKSSVFAGLEYVYTNRVGEAELRSYNYFDDGDNYFFNYLKHYKNNPECTIYTPSGQYKIDNIVFPSKELRLKTNPNNFFISDYNIYDNGRRNYNGRADDETSFHFLIAKSLGLQDYIDFQFLINDLATYRRQKESRELSKLLNEKRDKEIEIINWKIEVKKRENEVKSLEESNESVSSIELQKKFENDNLLYQKAKQIYFPKQPDLKNLINLIKDFNKAYRELKAIPVGRANEMEIEFLSLGVELLKNSVLSDCPFCNASKKDISTISDEANLKISNYDKVKSIKDKTSEFYSQVVESLIQIQSYFQTIVQSINLDLQEFSNNPLFLDLYNNQKELRDVLEQTLSGQMQEIQRVIISRRTFSEINFEILNNLLNSSLSTEVIDAGLYQITSFLEYRNQIFQKIEIDLKSRQVSSTTIEKIAILKNEIQKFSEQIKLSEDRMLSINKDVPKYQKLLDLLNEIKEEAIAIKNIIGVKISEVVNSVFTPVESTIKTILDDYFDDKNASLEIYREPSVTADGEVLGEILKARIVYRGYENPIDLSPNEYFNTFRYRLFCLMISCSVAVATRNLTKVNLPFVLDDIFYASDYLNRSTIVTFLRKLISLINKYSPPELKLQFILFTHDEMIFDCATEAIEDIEDQIEAPIIHPRDSIMYMRMSNKVDTESIQLEIEDQKFWSLVLKIPTQIPSFYELIK